MNPYEHVLTIGADYQRAEGGIGQILTIYATFYKPFHFIPTSAKGGKLKKLCVFLAACFRFVVACLLKPIKVVHIHGASHTSFWRKSIFIITARVLQRKIVYHIHGGEFGLFYGKHTFFVRKVLNMCDVVVALSPSWKDYFSKIVSSRTRVVVINNVVPARPPFYRRSSQPGGLFHMSCLAGISRKKGIGDVFDLLSENRDKYHGRLVFVFAGNGEIDWALKEIEEKRLGELTDYRGWADGRQKGLILEQSDFFILPSYHEGMPVAILEAMSYSLPVVATRVGGIPELIDDGVNGYLVEPGNKPQLERAIDLVMSNPSLREEMGRESYNRVQPYFPEEVEKSLLNLYRMLFNNLKEDSDENGNA